MSGFAIILILLSAFIHAWWNLISKRSSPNAAFFLVANSTGAWIFFPWVITGPDIVLTIPGRVWVLLIATGLFQAFYCMALASAYRHGDLSVTYPIARSLPVILVPFVSVVIGRGHLLGGWFLAGTLLVLTGGILIASEDVRSIKIRLNWVGALPMAVLAAVGTTGYSMIDDRALRILRGTLADAHTTVHITLVYAFFEALACAGWLAVFVVPKRLNFKDVPAVRAVGAGILMYLTYGMVLLAMAYARDISLIVAFRQVSILIGAVMGLVILKEALHRWKLPGLVILFTGLLIVAMS